ncbi:predicted protein [Naegleria gruberi]|uniref:Predicted protein n=1 Tax=Naegleria gruberi TaxID=5762 RepID=D2VIJ9_NAEGR|nr:uncharacterized protein NAEGRDRAFT_68705 [Naegleria gruberi]EFC43282.1 predicted protein [Naegleria gruberi]|eukprot:XP_002676026.1 predicted protein [Naegleria gruberi strain NEG-M]
MPPPHPLVSATITATATTTTTNSVDVSAEVKPIDTTKRYQQDNRVDINTKDAFANGFSKYFLNDLFSDISINHIPTNRSYRCHRIILAHQSQFFESLFTCAFRDSSGSVEVHFEDTESVFEKVLEYLYTGKVNIPVTSIVALHVAADQLICPDLSNSVMNLLDQFISNENVFSFLDDSLKLYDDGILEKACGYIALNFVQLIDEFNLIFLDLPPQVFFGIIAHENIGKGPGAKTKKCALITECVNEFCKKNNVLENVEMLKMCIDAMAATESITPDSAAFYLMECEKHGLVEHQSACTRILAANFNDIKDTTIINQFNPDTFSELVDLDELNVKNEDQVFEIVLSFLVNKKGLDLEKKQVIGQKIRIPFLSYDKLQIIMEKKEPILIESIPHDVLSESLLERIRKLEKKGLYKICGDESPKYLRPRTARLFTHTSDFDEGGVLYWLGTLYHTETYSSPIGRGLLKVTTSIGFEAGSDEDVISRVPVSCNLINSPNTTITFEFVSNMILPSAYTIRHTNARDTECLRTWRFQGSIDGLTFTDLKVHNNDSTLTTKSQSATFPITDCNEYYKYFRILQDGPNSSSNNYLSFGGFEIYGAVKLI